MISSAHLNGADGMVSVRLSDIPRELRVRVAGMIVDRGGFTGEAALDLMLAAEVPIQDPVLVVDRARADRVLAGRLPGGAMPRVWLDVGRW